MMWKPLDKNTQRMCLRQGSMFYFYLTVMLYIITSTVTFLIVCFLECGTLGYRFAPTHFIPWSWFDVKKMLIVLVLIGVYTIIFIMRTVGYITMRKQLKSGKALYTEFNTDYIDWLAKNHRSVPVHKIKLLKLVNNGVLPSVICVKYKTQSRNIKYYINGELPVRSTHKSD